VGQYNLLTDDWLYIARYPCQLDTRYCDFSTRFY